MCFEWFSKPESRARFFEDQRNSPTLQLALGPHLSIKRSGTAGRNQYHGRRLTHRITDIAMRLFVLLALVAFTGCQARVVRSDELKSQLLVARDTVWDYITQAKESAEETLENLRQSKFGQKVIAKIQDSAEVAGHYATIVQDQVSVISHEAFNKVSEQLERLSERLWQDFIEVRKQLVPYTEKLREKSEELMQTLEQRVQELQSQLGPYTEELKDKIEKCLQEYQQSVAPLVENLHNQLALRARILQQSLAPYADDLKEKMDP
ncbi:hypothetical protein GJAV_G00005550 [Gymnothorax javanicus]|nr:hypothetical protein GJAV_G00005550 [Gymnothorax javanicus]